TKRGGYRFGDAGKERLVAQVDLGGQGRSGALIVDRRETEASAHRPPASAPGAASAPRLRRASRECCPRRWQTRLRPHALRHQWPPPPFRTQRRAPTAPPEAEPNRAQLAPRGRRSPEPGSRRTPRARSRPAASAPSHPCQAALRREYTTERYA